MKNILFCIVSVLISSVPLCAQDLDFGDIMGAATEFVNEAQGTAETEADNQSLDQIIQQLLHRSRDSAFRGLMDHLTIALKEFENEFGNESYTGKCLQVMGAYAETLAYADRSVELAGNACEKKEWLGIEGLLLLAGGTINYCPTEFYGLSDEDLSEWDQKLIRYEYKKKITNYFFGSYDNYSSYFIKAQTTPSSLNIDLQQMDLRFKNFVKNIRNNEDYKDSQNLDEMIQMARQQYEGARRATIKEFYKSLEKDLPHIKLFEKFRRANEQLNLHGHFTEGKAKILPEMTVFVGEMFTPEFMLSKTIEIAKLSNLYKCSN